MLKGGYQIINLDNHLFTSGVGFEIKGIYDIIEGTRKAILISGLVLDGTEYHDCFTTPEVNGSNFEMLIKTTKYEITISIQDNDIITISKN